MPVQTTQPQKSQNRALGNDLVAVLSLTDGYCGNKKEASPLILTQNVKACKAFLSFSAKPW
jgi:hypothetical protein